jgi:hypothetical protein
VDPHPAAMAVMKANMAFFTGAVLSGSRVVRAGRALQKTGHSIGSQNGRVLVLFDLSDLSDIRRHVES